MNAYPDTSFLVSLYTFDANSLRAVAVMRTAQLPLPFTPLLEAELRNAIRLRVFRGEITTAQRATAFAQIEADVSDQVLTRAGLDWAALLSEAERLGLARTEASGTRTLDVLHVAAARVLGSADFLTFDARQTALAQHAGLRVSP